MSAIGLPAHILALFVPRPPIDYIKPMKRKERAELEGIADFVRYLDSTVISMPNIAVERPNQVRIRKVNERDQRARETLQDLTPIEHFS
jgi:U1 small nuclear ribonucleoprotein 70kDa